MTDTANLALPCIEGSQAQKHITHNEALRVLDTLVQLAVLDRDLTAPPGSPAEGQRWIVKTGATGAWASHVNGIAAWQDGAWQFSTPRIGWLAYVVDESVLLAWNGSAWVDAIGALSPTALNNMTLLGVGTIADTTNPLSVKLNNVLFAAKTVAEGGDGNLRYKLSKESAAKTLSFLFQDNYSGRAEIGLTGDDDFHFKVSPDGTTWYDGIKIAAATGKVTFPSGVGTGREPLAANRTYYVRTDGSDANAGLANTSGSAFLTIQKAIDTVAALDLSIYDATIQIADGSYSAGGIVSGPWLGTGNVTIMGNTTTPSNVVVSSASGAAVGCKNNGRVTVAALKLTTTGSGTYGLLAQYGGVILWTNLVFGACVACHIRAEMGGICEASGNYTISGNAPQHIVSVLGGAVRTAFGITVTLTGAPTFSSAFATANACGVYTSNASWSGSASGPLYNVSLNAVINTSGLGLPSGLSGTTTATGGQYL
jgi:hypothetical protein